MKSNYQILLIVLVVNLLATHGFSQTFNWKGDGYADYSNGGIYKNIDGSGIDLRITGLHNDNAYGRGGVRTGINSQEEGSLIHEYHFIFSEKVNLRFTVTNIDLDTVGGWCFIDDVLFSGHPVFSNFHGVRIIGVNLVIPKNDGGVTVTYSSIDTVIIYHGKGAICYPGYLIFSELEFRAVKKITKKPIDQQEFNDMLFDTGKSEITAAHHDQLKELVTFMSKNPMSKIQISGHTDNVGNEVSNAGLAAERLKSVKHYLLKKGVKEERIEIRNFGEEAPINSNATEADRKRNRRVVVKIILE